MRMINPFDLRTIVFAKHAQHVVLIHFPIALGMLLWWDGAELPIETC